MNSRESALPRPLAMRLAATEYDLAGRRQRPELDPFRH